MVPCTFLQNLYNWDISQYSSNGTEITEADLNFYIDKAEKVLETDCKLKNKYAKKWTDRRKIKKYLTDLSKLIKDKKELCTRALENGNRANNDDPANNE